MIASADGDLPNTDASTGLACASGPTPHWRLVPFDNNIGQRNVAPVAGGGGVSGLVASFENRSFTARNPFDRTARIKLESLLPDFLKKRGWTVQFRSAGGAEFSLPARHERQVRFTLVPGGDFAPSDVPAHKPSLIQVQTRVDGLLVGGMSYHVDPTLKRPPSEQPPGKAPGDKDECRDNDRERHIHHCGSRTRIVIEIGD